MSVLTKVFVVLVTVLSVVLVALVVPFVAKTEDYKAKVDDANQRAAAADALAQLKQGIIDALNSKESLKVAELNAARTNLETQLIALNGKLASAENEALEAKSAKAKSEADLTRLAAAELQHAEINKAQETELGQRRTDMVNLQTQLIQVADRLKEVESQLLAADRQHKRDAETLVQLQEENGKLQSGPAKGAAAASAGSTPAAFEPENPIAGAVTDVQKSEGETFVQINVGKNDGVQENMKFLVHRGDQYLGSLVISFVDAKASSGRLQLQKGDVNKGDQVLSGGR